MLPADGDVVIAKDLKQGRGYTLGVAPGPPQVRYPTYEQASARAIAWSVGHAVAVWLTEDGTTFVRVPLVSEPARTRARGLRS